MNKKLSLRGRRGRGTVMTVLSVLVLVAGFLLGIGANALKTEWNSYVDMTREGLYTLTDAFLEEVGDIEDELTITFCADPDILLNNYSTRYVYVMAREIEKHMPNVKVVTCDVAKNPTAVQEYRTTSSTVISWNHVIISCGKRYRMMAADAFWSIDSSSEDYFSFNGEYKMAGVMLSITAVKNPVAYFTVGHGERVYDPARPDDAENERYRAFWQLLRDEGLAVKTIDLDTQDVPKDCVLLVMNGPTEDYAVDPEDWYQVNATGAVERLDRYLDEAGSFMLFKDPEAHLPVLEEYLEEWGIAYEAGVTVKEPRSEAAEDTRDKLLAVYPDSEKDPLGYSLFGEVAGLASAPRVMIPRSGVMKGTWVEPTKFVSNAVSAMTSSVFYSSAEARAYDGTGALTDDGGSYSLARMTTRVYTDEVRDYYSYVFATASTAMVETAYLENPTYANYDVMFAAIRTISRTDEYASDALGGLNMNSENYGGKRLHSEALSATDKQVYKDGKVVRTYYGVTLTAAVLFTVLILTPSVVLLVVGTVRCVRRRYR